ncbi:ParB/RepB/Spo0J family partition protein [Tunturiibacter gelidoferens]|uniref:ParB/RepB/Spo0J family partition protein n=1 Tax=Tunturiibacter lichenicola TaxID=2051959 RepID=A0A7Y9T2W1_9BACT|nr:ParB/RepB/Spo0J family partition protein [Edaphobacter lichenicola]NYF51656.1 ParB/RepB/Spo0J family partition protein [Edaphobacter lichenicola]
MQDSSAFQFIAIDQIHESTTNPRLTFEQSKLEELAESIRQHGLIQPVTVRPAAKGFEIVAGARRFRASQLAELFSIPARIVELDDAAAMEWQLVENSQRVDVHPYEEAQGFQRLLDMPGYDVAALVLKSGKSASHIYARLSLLQLIPAVAQAFVEERITASHANLIARLPQEHQAAAFEQCWRKDWNDKEPHLLPASHFAGNDENGQQTDEEIVLAALDNTAEDKLTGFALRLALTDHVGIPRENEPDPLSEAEAAFAPPQPKSSKPKNSSKSKETPTLTKAAPKKSATKKQKAA